MPAPFALQQEPLPEPSPQVNLQAAPQTDFSSPETQTCFPTGLDSAPTLSFSTPPPYPPLRPSLSTPGLSHVPLHSEVTRRQLAT